MLPLETFIVIYKECLLKKSKIDYSLEAGRHSIYKDYGTNIMSIPFKSRKIYRIHAF